jgi:hypothetical protein
MDLGGRVPEGTWGQYRVGETRSGLGLKAPSSVERSDRERQRLRQSRAQRIDEKTKGADEDGRGGVDA